ncbi:zinc finger SWIM domain-containing protein 8 homolog [Halyomorpha halys]|uniref:zinc finger SWIM domain-containing protein 8 homolog n=1 Tax=Halyomorpha halys TaxID=286706 RepID=UPI0006D51166|nr:zinc finger SWIM domain-containing protein 8 isoform X3 [Halyomorpha halys]
MSQVASDMLEIWNDEKDRFSFEDSDRFEEDSLCSWSTEPESICNNWRGWKRPIGSNSFYSNGKKSTPDPGSQPRVPQLCELAARCVASHIPFELVEHVYPPVPEQLQLRIAFWSFPDNEEDIRLYSCLANSSADEFQRGEHLFKSRAVKDPLQIGFHLSATVLLPASYTQRGQYNVAVAFDRRRITSCNCTCDSSAYWCSHIVAVCLHRIHLPTQVCLRAPVSESLSRLHRDQLQKFAQYLISELPQQILPTAQRILDELLSSQPSAINSVCGAPDPTAGASVNEQTSWYLDEKTLHDNIKKILIKFCVPAPIVFSDVNYLSTTAPPAAAEWTSLLRPLRGREPEGMWNLLSIVREMYKRSDRNALPLLQIITEECMACEQIMVWWFNTKVALHVGVSSGGKHSNVNSNSHGTQHACASLCDEVVILWRLAALNPALSPQERSLFSNQFNEWHLKIVDKVEKSRPLHANTAYQTERITKNLASSIEVFSGFKPAISACQLDWEDYQIPGVTYQGGASWLAQPITCFKNADPKADTPVNPISSSQAVLNQRGLHHNYCNYYARQRRTNIEKQQLLDELEMDLHIPMYHLSVSGSQIGLSMGISSSVSGNRSSVSSEGFCENDQDQNNQEEDIHERANHPLDPLDLEGLTGSESSSSSCSERRDNLHPPASESPSGDESEASKQEPPQPDPRRLSKDDSLSSNSDSQQSSDEYFVYYYDPKSLEKTPPGKGIDKKEDERQKLILNGVSGPKDPWDVLFARAEGLHAHGHNKEACILGVRLAEDLLDNPPNLMVDLPPIQTKGKRKKINPASHQLSILASDTLAKCAFLCTVLAENPEHYHLAFRVGLFGLEMPRPPATTKPLEVKLFHQESELVTLLKRIPLGEYELNMIRERAELLRDGILRSRGEALLPITLASFILDALTMPVGRESRCQLISQQLRLPSDEILGFEAATAALGLKANVSEADHPLLCEGTRRQRGDLAVTLLVHYKDQPVKIAHIMEKLLDREVHQLTKTPLSSIYYTTHPPVKSMLSAMNDWNSEVEHPPLETPPLPVDPNLGMSMRSTPCSSSAELEACLPTKPLNISHGPQTATSSIQTSTRVKESRGYSRFKGKRAYPSIPNQPSEAGAHFMFELAKTVLIKAGGNSSTSLFTQALTSQNHHGPQRALHMCAFQLGLYALGLHNCVSPNWLSRTYSSHVSWITGQAMEIGAPAISFLQDTWEGHLTPPEAASIADRASRGCDRNMTRAAAELALSCLPHAHALNQNEIQRAILQCKEQSDRMLEHSCLTVEGAAKGGGVYPDVLFQVAKYWFELYMRNSQGDQLVDEGLNPASEQHAAMPEQHVSTAMVTWVEPQPPPTPPPPPPPQYVSPIALPYPLITIAPPPGHYQLRHPQQIALQTFHLPGPPFQYYQASHPTHVFSATPIQVGPGQAQIANIAQAPAQPVSQPPPQVVTVAAPVRPQQQVQRTHQQYTPAQVRYLLAAYRVGMLAMETIARRVHDDRPNAKYARHPPYGDDVKWLLRIAEKLGTQYLQQFCVCAVNSIVSPFILHDVAIEAAHYLARNNPTLVMQHLRSSLTPLVQKCQQMYIQCLHQKLYHLSSAEYDEFLNLVLSARAAFQITPEGSQQFKEWLQSIRRSKSCKKELWAQISVLLQPSTGK